MGMARSAGEGALGAVGAFTDLRPGLGGCAGRPGGRAVDGAGAPEVAAAVGYFGDLGEDPAGVPLGRNGEDRAASRRGDPVRSACPGDHNLAKCLLFGWIDRNPCAATAPAAD